MPSHISSKIQQLWKRFHKKPFRDAFVAGQLADTIAAQIVATREARGWTQTKLAQETGMAQARISLLEDSSYEKMTLTTLKRLASAFDVALVVRFVPFSEHVEWAANVTPDKLAPREFKDDHLAVGIPMRTAAVVSVRTPHYSAVDDDEFTPLPNPVGDSEMVVSGVATVH